MNPPISANAIADTHGWIASPRPDTSRLMRRARRHSRFVKVARVVLPIGTALGLGGLAAFAYFDPLHVLAKLPSVAGKLAVTGSKITMELPKIAGYTRDGRSYELTAATAVQDITKPDTVELRDLRATMQMADESIVRIAAASGIYNPKGDQLLLRDEVTIDGAGYKGRFREAAVDVKQGKVVSEQPVEVALPDGLIKANRLEILDSGDVIRFDGGVVVTLDAQKKPPSEGTPQ